MLWKDNKLFVGNMLTVESNKSLSLGCNLISTHDIRNSKSSRICFAFLILLRTRWKIYCLSFFPCWRNIVARVAKLLNFIHKTFPVVLPTYKGLSLKGGSWLRSPTSMMDLLPKGQLFFSINSSHNRECICMNNLDPRNLILPNNIYQICLMSYCNTINDFACIAFIYLIGTIGELNCIILLKWVVSYSKRIKHVISLVNKNCKERNIIKQLVL